MTGPFPGVRAVVFDAYGTLLDVAAAARRCRGDLGDQAEPLAATWRTKQLEYTWLRSLMGTYADFWQVTGEALDFAMAAHGIDDANLRTRLMDLYARLDAYPDAVATLEALRGRGLRTAILSNGSPAMLAAAREHPEWDFVFSPHPALITQLERGAAPLDSPAVRTFRAQWDALDNTEVFGGGDYGPVFERSDVCFTDGLSWLLEYQLVAKPVVFLERQGHRPFNEIGERVLAGVHTVADGSEGVRLMEGFAGGAEDPLRDEQGRITDELFGPPGAAGRIVDAVRSGFAEAG